MSLSSQGIGEVITFYSYKGGTGRSMLLANVAWGLAQAGKRVLVMDWDLEAPGLHRYFKPFLSDRELKSTDGILQWLNDYWDAVLDSDCEDIEEIVRGFADPRNFVVKLNTGAYIDAPGGIDFMGPGRQDVAYAMGIANFDFAKLYSDFSGAAFIATAKKLLTGIEGYDYVLIDSRTGVSDTAGICTVGFADTLVTCFTYNNQSAMGAANVAKSARKSAEAERTPERNVERGYELLPFRVFGIPSRIDPLDPERLQRRQDEAWTLFADVVDGTVGPADMPQYWLDVEIPYQALYAYEEVLAIAVERTGEHGGVLAAVRRIVEKLTNHEVEGFVAITDVQQRELRESFFSVTESVSTGKKETAWERFVQRHPEETERDALLELTYPLLVQFFEVLDAPEAGNELGKYVQRPVSELDLTNGTKQFADSLLNAGLLVRRTTNSRDKFIELMDGTALQNSKLLQQKLSQDGDAITTRMRLSEAREAWEGSRGRVLYLAGLPGKDELLSLPTDKWAYLGSRNLALIESIRDLYYLQRQSSDLASRIDELRLRNQVAEEQTTAERRIFQERTKTIEERANEAAKLQYVRIRNLAGTFAVIVAVLAGLFARSYNIDAEKAKGEVVAANEARNKAVRVADINATRTNELELQLRQRQDAAGAGEFFARGYSLVKDKRFKEAEAELTKAIELNPDYALAFQWRGRTRLGLSPPDRENSNLDYARYFDLRPKLSERTELFITVLKSKPLNLSLAEDLLTKILSDSESPAARDVSPRLVATKLAAAQPLVPSELSDKYSDAVNKLDASTGKRLSITENSLKQKSDRSFLFSGDKAPLPLVPKPSQMQKNERR